MCRLKEQNLVKELRPRDLLESSSDSDEKVPVAKPSSLSKRKLELEVETVEKKKKGRPRKDSRLMPVSLSVQVRPAGPCSLPQPTSRAQCRNPHVPECDKRGRECHCVPDQCGNSWHRRAGPQHLSSAHSESLSSSLGSAHLESGGLYSIHLHFHPHRVGGNAWGTGLASPLGDSPLPDVALRCWGGAQRHFCSCSPQLP